MSWMCSATKCCNIPENPEAAWFLNTVKGYPSTAATHTVLTGRYTERQSALHTAHIIGSAPAPAIDELNWRHTQVFPHMRSGNTHKQPQKSKHTPENRLVQSRFSSKTVSPHLLCTLWSRLPFKHIPHTHTHMHTHAHTETHTHHTDWFSWIEYWSQVCD